MRLTSLLLVVGVTCAGLLGAEAGFGENLVEVKLTLTQSGPYLRGATDPVAGLVAQVTLANRTHKEDRNKETVTVATVAPLTAEDLDRLAKLTREQRDALLDAKKSTTTVSAEPVNKDSLGVAYVDPNLTVPYSIDFVIMKLPPEGQADAKPVRIQREELTDHAAKMDIVPTRYLAAGETAPAITLDVGKYYLIREPGWYSIKAVLPLIGDTNTPSKYAESNEEKFQVLPLKIVNQKIDAVKAAFASQQNMPAYDFLLFQVATTEGYDEIYAVQRIPVRGFARWEWTRVCSVRAGSTAQIAQLGLKKVALYAMHAKGDAGLYTLDFSGIGPTIKVATAKDGGKLKVEGDTVSVE